MIHRYLSSRVITWRALLCGLSLACSPTVVAAAQTITFQAAVQKLLQHNPNLAVYQVRRQSIAAEKTQAALKPAYEIGLEAENLAATNDPEESPVQFTLSLSSVIEPSSKRNARMGLVSSSANYLLAEQQLQALDLLTEAGRHFVSLLSLQEQRQLARQSVELAEKTLSILESRMQAGALSQADVMRERAALSRARLMLAKTDTQWRVRAQALSAMWGELNPTFDQVQGELYRIADLPTLNAAKISLHNHPRIDLLAEKTRLQQAEVALAQAQANTNIRWSLGVRHYEATDSQALVAGVSVPLFSAGRNQSAEQIARVSMAVTQAEKEAALLSLQQILFQAYAERKFSVLAIQSLRESTLPALQRALKVTEQAYQQGRYSYLEWHTALEEYLQAQRDLIDAGMQLQNITLLIEQLINAPVSQVKN